MNRFNRTEEGGSRRHGKPCAFFWGGGGATWATAATDEHVQDQPFLPRRPARRFSASRAPILSIPNSCVMCRRPRSRSRARSSGRSSYELETRNSQGKRRASSPQSDLTVGRGAILARLFERSCGCGCSSQHPMFFQHEKLCILNLHNEGLLPYLRNPYAFHQTTYRTQFKNTCASREGKLYRA